MAYSNSNLISYVDTNTDVFAPREQSVSRVTLHCAEGNFTLPEYSSILHNGVSRSWNYAIDSDGNVGMFVEEKYQSSGTGDSENDSVSVNIQLSCDPETFKITDLTLSSIYNLCEDIARRNSIVRYEFNKNNKSGNITLHKWFEDVDCPHDYIESLIPKIVDEVNTRLFIRFPSEELSSHYVLNPQIVCNTSSSAQDSGGNVYGTYSPKSQYAWSMLNPSTVTPYIVTLDRNSEIPNFRELKSIGVSGALIEAGYLYSINHIKQPSFDNPKLRKQIKSVKESELKLAFFFYGRAHTTLQVKQEVDELNRILRNNSPDFGVWVRPEMNQSLSMNDKLIDEYYNRLSDIGLKGKVGLYATPAQLIRITWEQHYEKWFLWLDKHVNNSDELTSTVDNSFFVV